MNSWKLATSLVRNAIAIGCDDFLLSPGSRNSPLSIALYQAEQKGLIRLHVRLDERGAAFFALGITKATGKYVPVVCTSGTAVANLFPAVLEAHHGDNNLLLLTADRPAWLRNTGSNQTTLQANIFGEFVRRSIDTDSPVDLEHLLNGSGPVHINLQFDEPLLPQDTLDWLEGIQKIELKHEPVKSKHLEVTTSRNIVIVGHDRAGVAVHEIEKFAYELGAPIISEDPLRFKNAVAHVPFLFSDARVRRVLRPELAVVVGRTTLSLSTNTYIQLAEKTLVVDSRAKKIDTARSAHEIYDTIPTVNSKINSDQNWIQAFKVFESLARKTLSTYPEWSEGGVASLLAAELEKDSALFISSSRPIRDLEAFASPRAGVITYSNRGLAGIDGNISTAMGIASCHEKTFAIIGDLAFLHDISALSNLTKDVLTIIVVDNNGGGIFSTLPQRKEAGFEKIFGTPHDKDLERIVSGFGVSNEVIVSAKELKMALQRRHSDTHVIIAKMPNRDYNAKLIEQFIDLFKTNLQNFII